MISRSQCLREQDSGRDCVLVPGGVGRSRNTQSDGVGALQRGEEGRGRRRKEKRTSLSVWEGKTESQGWCPKDNSAQLEYCICILKLICGLSEIQI